MTVQECARLLLAPACPYCGKPKRENHVFCGRCYFRLPRRMEAALYRRYGEGFETAYVAATEYLEKFSGQGARSKVKS